jgi:hypothetical protein
MGRRPLLFFAVKEDLLPVLALVDSKDPLKYALTGNFASHEVQHGIPVYQSGVEIPDLGKARYDSSTACDSFLVCHRETPIDLRYVGINGERVCVDQLINPDSIEFSPGGVWKKKIVLQGRIATASDSPHSQALLKRFQAAITKMFSKVRAYRVGPKALALLKSGKRLTASAQSPRERDVPAAWASG